jgi:hypothetical protein
MYLEKISLDLEEEKTSDAIGMLRIISERTLDVDEELWACLIDWQKAFDGVDWAKLMQVLNESGIDWRERKLISKLYMNQNVKVRLDQGEKRSVNIGRGFRQGCCLSPILFNLHNEDLNKEVLEGCGDFKQEEKYADDLVYWLRKKRCCRA